MPWHGGSAGTARHAWSSAISANEPVPGSATAGLPAATAETPCVGENARSFGMEAGHMGLSPHLRSISAAQSSSPTLRMVADGRNRGGRDLCREAWPASQLPVYVDRVGRGGAPRTAPILARSFVRCLPVK
jgi:hypothetical protein